MNHSLEKASQSGILRDMALNDKLIYTLITVNKITPGVDYNYLQWDIV